MPHCALCALRYTLKAYMAGGNPRRSPAVLAGGGGYAAAAGGGATPKNSAKNKKPFSENPPKVKSKF
nr:MAG TPA: hypothetical protein [Caudoviricetes sp.]